TGGTGATGRTGEVDPARTRARPVQVAVGDHEDVEALRGPRVGGVLDAGARGEHDRVARGEVVGRDFGVHQPVEVTVDGDRVARVQPLLCHRVYSFVRGPVRPAAAAEGYRGWRTALPSRRMRRLA